MPPTNPSTFTRSELRQLAASRDSIVSKLALQLLEAKNEIAACCDEIQQLGGRPH